MACAASLLAQAPGRPRSIDIEQSTITVQVFKSGLFSAFADNHVISAPLASGSISDTDPPGVTVKVHSADLRVLDPDLAANRRAEIQARMLGPEVLDASRFPEIVFESTTVDRAAADRWQVTGRLSIRGQTRTISFPVVRAGGRYRGDVAISQRDFGIEPIKIAGGAVKVKDHIRIQFEIAA